ncbi:MAG: prepilin-type N-terminal cleavage/methylation domain-containing protein [bacterium]
MQQTGTAGISETQAAFTLIEALIAVAIMSISSFALMAAATRCLAVANSAREMHRVAAVIDRGELEHPLLPTNEISENVVEPVTYDNGFTFERTYEPLGKEKDLFVIKTRVSWATRGKRTSQSVETLLYTTNHP